MQSSQKDFFIGCLIGGAIGASAALFMPKTILNGTSPKSDREHRNNTTSRTQEIHTAAKNFTTRKPRPKKSLKHK